MTPSELRTLSETIHTRGKSLVLVGMMGVGKTTVGRRLAKALSLDFTDCDQAIEEAAGMTVADIFDTFGEQEFRAGERRVIERLVAQTPQVIATGGGAFITPETRALIQSCAIAIWLDADLDVLVERTSRRDTRPLLRGGNREKILADLLAKRRPCYREAPLHVESGGGPHSDVVAKILTALSAYMNRLSSTPVSPTPSADKRDLPS